MNRRAFFGLVAGCFAWPFLGRTTPAPLPSRQIAMGRDLEILGRVLLTLPEDVKARFLAQLGKTDAEYDLRIIRL